MANEWREAMAFVAQAAINLDEGMPIERGSVIHHNLHRLCKLVTKAEQEGADCPICAEKDHRYAGVDPEYIRECCWTMLEVPEGTPLFESDRMEGESSDACIVRLYLAQLKIHLYHDVAIRTLCFG